MSQSILQQFLNLQFIKTDETALVENLEKVVSNIVKHLAKKRHKVIAYTLVALDPDVKDDDPIMREVEELIIKEWRTFKNSTLKTHDSAVTYIRAVILEALTRLAEDLEFAAIIWHSGRNLVGRYSLGREKDVIKAFLISVGESVWSGSVGYWNGKQSIGLPEISSTIAEIPNLSSTIIHASDIENHLKAAFIHSGWASRAGGGENPHTQGENSFNWPKFAAERAAIGLAEEINKSVSKQDHYIDTIVKLLSASNSRFSENLSALSNGFTDTILANFEANNRREKLLWWKESLYSPSLRKGYRTLPELEIIFTMAIDCSKMVSPIYPESIDHFLTEALRDLIGDKAYQKVPFQELVQEFCSLSESSIKMFEVFSTKAEGRLLLGSSILMGGFRKDIQVVEFLPLCGVKNSFEICRADFLLWLFHDAQALKLANQK